MNPERWKKLEDVYNAALPMNRDERRAFLMDACAGDEELQREAETLFAADDVTDDFLQDSAFSLGMKVLADEETRGYEMTPGATIPFEKSLLDDRYEISEVIEAGGMGEVYKARDTHVPGRLVVIKVLKEEWLNNEWVVDRFKREAAVLASIDDPGVVDIFDAGISEGQPYLVMKFVEGSDLRQPIKEADQGMAFAEVAEIMKQVGRTLTAAHQAGVIHRDLKPGNIMIRRNTSGDLQVTVIDFGIAKVKHSTISSGPATEFLVGTWRYMSPEQIKEQEVTPASDVYALGVIAYEMLTGRHPFNAKSVGDIQELQKNGALEPGALRDGLSEAANRAILRALEYEAIKRQQSAREFGDELAQALTNDPPPLPMMPSLPVSPPTEPIIDKQPYKRWRTIATLLITVIIVSAIIMIIGKGLWLKPDGPRPDPVAMETERTLIYWLPIQRQGKPARASESETFATGDRYRFSATAPQAGALYLFNEGTSGKWHILFPTPENSQLDPRLTAWQTLETKDYVFTQQSGAEKIWIVWATQPIQLLDDIVKRAANDSLTISDPSQQATLRQFMEKGARPENFFDKEQSQTTLKGRDEVLVHLLELKHR